ncbi:MAG: hypothetical protein EP313_06595 [Bacteroidetes bacterium]|nr:MAG: hypothetical protein EP313_06595 [Bacteroidota bacterium]
MKRASFIIMVTLLLTSCTGYRLNFDGGIISPVPVNFPGVNSSFDDYNSDLRITWSERGFTLIFSTNRNSLGNDFDFISFGGNIFFDLLDGEFKISAWQNENGLLEQVNTDSNEFGPLFTADYPYFYTWKNEGTERFFYSSDQEGNLDIWCCKYLLGNDVFDPLEEPFVLTALNSGSDDGYLTLHTGGLQGRETVYFMSDRDGSFDIYQAVSEEGKLISDPSAVTVTRVAALSSSSSDKCPFICGNTMVFASDREGGYGGFDLWYSVWNGQDWSVPVNMGAHINSEYDEYRPIVVSGEEGRFLNDLLIFSSNRPGGKGGFDLYYAGVPRR